MHGPRVQAVGTSHGLIRRNGATARCDRRVAACARERADIQNASARRSPELFVADNWLVAIRTLAMRVAKKAHGASLGPTYPRQDPWPRGHEPSRVMQKR